ncbi:putative glycoside hydrolase [Rhodococcus koreensis]
MPGILAFRRFGRFRFALTAAITAVGLIAACSTPVEEPQVPAPAPGDPHSLTFPRTATYFLNQQELPSVDELARYDVVVIDNEWANRKPREYFDELRHANPRLRLLAYVNVVDHPDQLGSEAYWANRYALWQYDQNGESAFPDSWLAHTMDGAPVSEWPESTMTNLTDQAPRINGQVFAEYAANWVVDDVWSAGVWDGIFLDVWGDRIYSANRDHWDIDSDGTDEPDDAIYGFGNPWERGVNLAEQIIRQRIPDAILIANGDRTLLAQQLDGRAWEKFADPRADRNPMFDIEQYASLTAEGDHRMPGLAMTIDRLGPAPHSAPDFQRARYFLAATLLQDGFWAPMGADYDEPAYFDEMDGGGLGPGYLGHPLVANPSPAALNDPYADGVGSLGHGLFRRDFEHGIVLLNTDGKAREVQLETPFRRLHGSLDPSTNNGATVTSVTLQPSDGLVLLRENP